MTITGKILFADGTDRSNARVAFYPMSNPQIDASGVLTTPAIVAITDTSGNLPSNFYLKPGSYIVSVGYNKTDSFLITVSEAAGPVDINRLMSASDGADRTYFPAFGLPQAGVNYEVNGTNFSLRNQTTGKYNAIWALSVPPQIQLDDGLSVEFPLTLMSGTGNNWRIWNANFQLFNVGTSKWNTISLTGTEGSEQFVASEEIKDAENPREFAPFIGLNFRLHNNCFQLFNSTTGFYQTIYSTGADGVQQLLALPHE